MRGRTSDTEPTCPNFRTSPRNQSCELPVNTLLQTADRHSPDTNNDHRRIEQLEGHRGNKEQRIVCRTLVLGIVQVAGA